MGHSQAGFVQEFETLSKILSLAFGGSSKKKSASDENTVVPQSGAELRKAFNKVFG